MVFYILAIASNTSVRVVVLVKCMWVCIMLAVVKYSLSTFTCRVRFPVFLHEMWLKIEFQWQFWILLFLRIPKHPQKVEFDKDLAELLKVKHNTSPTKNFQLLSKQRSLYLCAVFNFRCLKTEVHQV